MHECIQAAIKECVDFRPQPHITSFTQWSATTLNMINHNTNKLTPHWHGRFFLPLCPHNEFFRTANVWVELTFVLQHSKINSEHCIKWLWQRSMGALVGVFVSKLYFLLLNLIKYCLHNNDLHHTKTNEMAPILPPTHTYIRTQRNQQFGSVWFCFWFLLFWCYD